jgi:hypothetical protein
MSVDRERRSGAARGCANPVDRRRATHGRGSRLLLTCRKGRTEPGRERSRLGRLAGLQMGLSTMFLMERPFAATVAGPVTVGLLVNVDLLCRCGLR